MSKKSKGKQTTKKDKRRGVRRQERRFVSQAATNPALVRTLGAVAALVLGAGAWAYFYATSFAADEKLKQLPAYLIAGGSVLMGIAIWFGTSSEPPVRVGAPGIALEKGDLRRMPWWGVEKVTFESDALVVTGKDEANTDWTFRVPLKSNPEAVAWIVKEARARIPRQVDIGEEALGQLPPAQEHAGQRVDLEALQVVGKRCAVTNKAISYEPDACVCERCERVYLKTSVPKKCKCGNSLVHLRPKGAEGFDEVEELDEDESEGTVDEPSDERSSAKIEAAEETADS